MGLFMEEIIVFPVVELGLQAEEEGEEGYEQ